MVIQNKIKISIIIYAIIMQFSLYAITENQARIGAGLLGILGAATVTKTENPTLIFTAGGAVCALGYMYLRKYTPAFRLNEAKNILDQIAHNKLANGFLQVTEDIKSEILKDKSVNWKLQTIHYRDRFDEMLVQKVTALYPFVFEQASYPLVTAMQQLKIAQDNIAQVEQLLNVVKPEVIKPVNTIDDSSATELWNMYIVANQRLQHFMNNSSEASNKISTMAQFKEQHGKFQDWQSKKLELQIQQQKADAATRSAQAAEKTAVAQTKQAAAVASKTELTWIKAWLCWLFNVRSN